MNPKFMYGLVLILAAAQAHSNAGAATDPTIAAVTAANDRVQRETQNYDAAAIDNVLTKDFVFVGSRGTVYGRAAFLADTADKTAIWISNTTEALSVHPYNEDAALAIGILRLRYRLHGKLFDQRLRFVDSWIKQNGQWKWATSQVAHLPDNRK